MRKALGFTLIEILLVIALIGILSVAALSSYLNSTRTFAFVSAYKDVIAILREPRAYAVAGQTVNGVPVQRFGVKILPGAGNDLTVFADNGTIPFEMDAGDTIYSKKDLDALSGDPSKPYVLQKDGTVAAMSDENILFPIYLFYETGTGNLAIYGKKGSVLTLISAAEMRYLAFNFLQDKTDFLKYITVFQTSGIAEGFDIQPTL
ncbi:MAG: type II secretion system protein [Candidatus Peregrinibacteria bacterium]|nr:type II secretion system protein [Candidatus Peregrinibacteria bacterium]